MSYILEALKKSQADRNLGHVPTIINQPLADVGKPSGKAWALTATGLAGLAVVIALYAVLRKEPGWMQTGRVEGADMQAISAAPWPPPFSTPTQAGQPANGGSPQVKPSTTSENPNNHPEGLASAADPRSGNGAAKPEPASSARVPPAGDEESEVATEEEEISEQERNHPPAASSPPADGIPDDLRRQIQAFKDQVQEDKSPKPAKKAEPQAPVPSGKGPTPKGVDQKIPPFSLTVHLYSTDPAKRFVIIDGHKMAEGEVSSSGILVQEILPDGVDLVFDGHKFFRPR